MQSIGIIVALPAEAKTITGYTLGFEQLIRLPQGHWLAVSGAGPTRADAMARKLASLGVGALISWGCAAAVADNVRAGDLVLAEQLLNENADLLPICPVWRQSLLSTLPDHLRVHGGAILEARSVVTRQAEKHSLFLNTGALAVDMESVAIARVACANQLKFLAVRAIADPASMNFPDAVSASLNPRGDVRIASLLGQIAKHPGQVSGLIALGRAFGSAMRTLHQIRQTSGTDFCLPGAPNQT